MRTRAFWITILAACGGVALAALVRTKRHSAKQAHNAELQEWENEGGSPMPSPEATDRVVAIGSD
jgi:hypothetical protein